MSCTMMQTMNLLSSGVCENFGPLHQAVSVRAQLANAILSRSHKPSLPEGYALKHMRLFRYFYLFIYF